jgi:hypothetical protein
MHPEGLDTLSPYLSLGMGDNRTSKKGHGNNYSFDCLCGLLIREYKKVLDEGKLEFKKQENFLKGEG